MAKLRMWIKQPSPQQPYHKYHGERVLADYNFDTYYLCEFADKRIPPMHIHGTALQHGWPAHLQNKQGVQDALQS